MKKRILNSNQSLTGMLTVTLFFLFVAVSHGQPCIGDLNPPSSPLCQPTADPFKILLVLDESGSIGGSENKVEAAVDSFAAILNRKSPGAGKFFMGIVEFDNANSNPIPVMDVKAATFVSTVKDYLYNFAAISRIIVNMGWAGIEIVEIVLYSANKSSGFYIHHRNGI